MDTILDVSKLQQQIEELTAKAEEQALLIAKIEILIKYYEEQFLLARRNRFGASRKNTVIDTDIYRQMLLFGEPDSALKAIPEPELAEVGQKKKKRKGKREEDLSGLPVERVEHELPETERVCPECNGPMRDIGTDIRRKLKLIPAKVVVVEHATHAYACSNCEKTNDHTPIIKADAPEPLIGGSLASPSLVAHIAVQKYSNGLPLYRIEKGFLFDGVNVSRQTMANWVIKCAETYLVALYFLMIKFLLKESVLHADETTLQVLFHRP